MILYSLTMATIHKAITIDAPVSKVWKALVSPEQIDKWGGGKAQMDDQTDTEFSLWGGDIHGKNIKVTPQVELIQEWFGGDWDKPSIVKFTLHSMLDKTILKLEHTDIPDKDQKKIDEGWDKYYLGPLKNSLEK